MIIKENWLKVKSKLRKIDSIEDITAVRRKLK